LGGIGGLYLIALLLCEACGPKAILQFHLPDRSESNGNMLTVEWSCLEAVTYFRGFIQPVLKFVEIVAIRSALIQTDMTAFSTYRSTLASVW
jgi:hypothetical protein